MVVKRMATKDMSLKDTAKLFHEHGVLLVDWHKGEEGPVHEIRFNGDDTAGDRAVQVARDLGLMPLELKRVWLYRHGLEEYPHWELYFYHHSLEPAEVPDP